MTKEDLLRYKQLEKERRQLLELMEAERSKIMYPRIPKLTGMPHATGTQDKVAESIARYIDATQVYAQKVDEVTMELCWIEDCINALPSIERSIIRYKYILLMQWEKIAQRLGYSVRQAQRIHDSALERLKNL